ncbi:MAG TPA: DUF2306 domain-containing protein [Gammaproteobacteria bacterium]|nr:DUF2306 domain-containing protein [Gammaproteobacteria bacterium]
MEGNLIAKRLPADNTMTDAVSTGGVGRQFTPSAVLTAAGRFWFLAAVTGQWLFAYYVALFYGGAAARGDLTAWNKVLAYGYIPGDTMGNLALGAHLLLAVIIIVGGPLQLVPQIRRYAPALHRWNGRVYLPTVFVASISGLYMIWFRGAVGDVVQHLGMSLDAVLIIAFAILALRYALAREISTHRRWALRLFMVVNGVWFFRVGLMLWLIVNQGAVGFDPKTFTGPFLSFLSFAEYLLPLAILEIYLRAKDGARPSFQLTVATGIMAVTLAMGVGIFAAFMGLWLPHI